jgi:hypothetical protein
MGYALAAVALLALVAAGAAYESRAPSRTAVPAIELRLAPVRTIQAPKQVKAKQVKAMQVKAKRKAQPKIQQQRKRASARARFSSGRGGAGAAPAPPSPPLRAGEDDSHGDDDGDDD